MYYVMLFMYYVYVSNELEISTLTNFSLTVCNEINRNSAWRLSSSVIVKEPVSMWLCYYLSCYVCTHPWTGGT